MQYLVYFVLMLISLVLQITIFAFYPVWGVTPDLLLIIVISSALLNGYRKGAYIGFFTGLIQDVFSSGLFGSNIVIKLILGYACGFLQKKIYPKSIIIPGLVITVSTIFSQLLMVILTDHIMLQAELWTRFKEVTLPLIIYHILLSLFIYPMMYYIKYKFLDNYLK
ncbi:rod shape-determining protein MreD [Selenihalanaerobacter shriftii]|uniref:Rod shape-determining protein MreD n=1 Tax=Selenihalanaerobacter shriftii TaxID=142842 RepID=A0A1T4PMU5_9FIRM|nr:rod shape-determining protein MreD [Selenihalanaerobacter shriftii]SJZ92914.1 rod shape-determining protein MreD [Selenihalanaerobacter shriftii]